MDQLPIPECLGRGSCDLCIARQVSKVITRHHRFYPSNIYTTKTERQFRNHPLNIDLLPWCEHQEKHKNEKPPEKPPTSHMAAFLLRATHENRLERPRPDSALDGRQITQLGA